MGSVLITGRGDHLDQVESVGVFSIPDTQADVLQQEVLVEMVDEDPAVWSAAAESGYSSDPPHEGRVLRVKISGHATVFVRHDGRVCVDNFST